MNPLAALFPDWRKKKAEQQKPPELPPMNRAGRRTMMKQIRKVIKQHGLKAG